MVILEKNDVIYFNSRWLGGNNPLWEIFCKFEKDL